MNKSFWLQGWKQGWHNPKAVDRTQVLASLKNYFDQLDLKQNDTVFVPLCGKSIDMLWLSEQQVNVIGVELSAIACEQFFKQHQLAYTLKKNADFTVYQAGRIELWCGDLFDFKQYYSGRIDAIYDCAALVALPPEMQQTYMTYLATLCRPGVKILLNSFEAIFDAYLMPPFPVNQAAIKQLCVTIFEVTELARMQAATIPAHYQARGCKETVNVTYLLEKH